MKVWTIEIGFVYEGSNVESVHKTKEGAEKAAAALRLTKHYDFVDVKEFELQD